RVGLGRSGAQAPAPSRRPASRSDPRARCGSRIRLWTGRSPGTPRAAFPSSLWWLPFRYSEQLAGRRPVPQLQSAFATLVVADANRLRDFINEDLAIADFAGARRRTQRPHHLLGPRVRNHHLELHLGKQVDFVLHSPVDLFVALLAAVAAHLGD